MVFWDKSGNKSVSIKFDGLNLNNIFRINNFGGKKGIDSYSENNVWILGFKFSVVNVNYDDIVFIKIDSKDNYSKCKNSRKINILKETLVSWCESKKYLKNFPSFNWNVQVNGENDYTFYLTGKKDWFIKNGLEELVNAFREITFNENEKMNFPKYNPRKTNIFSVINKKD